MIVLACGDRAWDDRALVEATLEYLRTHRSEPLTIVEGGARGADRCAGQWAARMRAHGVGWLRVAADWEKYGKRAGPIRNQAMLDYLVLGRESGQTVGVVAFHDGLEASKGTKDMVTRATKAGVPVKLIAHDAGAIVRQQGPHQPFSSARTAQPAAPSLTQRSSAGTDSPLGHAR